MEPGDPTSILTARLTAAQLEAVEAPDPRLAVYAGAGAGKTRVLTLRAARLVEQGADPDHVLVVTFSRKAAQELRSRLWRLGIRDVRAGTFHRTALDLIEIRRAELGTASPRLLTNRRGALQRIGEHVTGTLPRSAAGTLDTELSWAKANLLGPDDYVEAVRRTQRPVRLPVQMIGEIFAAYELHKRRQGMVDFDDLILEATDALDDPTFAAAVHWRTRHLLVDEFQDVNAAQFEFLTRLLGPDATFFCVGDPNQSIYGFNGSDPTLLRQLESRLVGTRVVSLAANHRSTPEIVLSAQAVLPKPDVRPLEATQQSGPVPRIYELEHDDAEARFIARSVWETRGPGGRWGSIAILARTNAQLDAVATSLEKAGIPATKLAPDTAQASDVTDKPAARLPIDEQQIDAVALSTFHRAKGLEWQSVFVIGASEGYVPHVGATTPEALDEERRLLYVALTRAERNLTVSWAARGRTAEHRETPLRKRSSFLDQFEMALGEFIEPSYVALQEKGARRAGQIRRQLAERLGRPFTD